MKQGKFKRFSQLISKLLLFQVMCKNIMSKKTRLYQYADFQTQEICRKCNYQKNLQNGVRDNYFTICVF